MSLAQCGKEGRSNGLAALWQLVWQLTSFQRTRRKVRKLEGELRLGKDARLFTSISAEKVEEQDTKTESAVCHFVKLVGKQLVVQGTGNSCKARMGCKKPGTHGEDIKGLAMCSLKDIYIAPPPAIA